MIDCHQCQHVKSIPGDCHIACNHPEVQLAGGSLAMFLHPRALNIKGNPHGIRNGWFFWPINFDPTWLENCDGFNKIEVI